VIARSTFYVVSGTPAGDAVIVAEMKANCDVFEA
jgi:hypothetical protein